ncbi:MAG: AsmA family protein, partial [Bacteroidota bacterium]|nr:AsmA family protein [Bacteroidota bacterium]
MNPRSRYKKIIGRILIIFLVTVVAIIGLLYYLVVHRFKESIKYIVNNESNGKYAFDADKATVSFFNKTVTLKKVSLRCLDTAGLNQYYDVKVPEIYFSFTSWKDLILNKKLIVDSLAIQNPDIFIHVNKEPEATLKQTAAFKTADILNFLEKTLAHFNAHSFSIKDLSFTYAKRNGPKPFHGDHISINIVNFTKVDNNDRHLFGSDTISLSLGRQNWILPDGIHEISFKNFNFYSSSQKIELDSFTFRQKATQGSPAVVIEGDKFFFNSSHLPTIYQKDELNIDTLFCLNPVLTIMGTGSNDNNKKNNPKKDSTVLSQASNALFKLVRIKFINVIDGEFHLKSNDLDTSTSGAHKSNASIYNLVIDNENNKSLTTDSIKINLKDIQFYSSDSLSKL